MALAGLIFFANNSKSFFINFCLLRASEAGKSQFTGKAMRVFLSVSVLFLAASQAFAAPPSKKLTPATFASHQTATEKQAAGVYDLSSLSFFKGTVTQFLPAPDGGVLGVLLNGTTEVLVSPELGHTLAGLIKTGDEISVRGVQAYTLPVIRAFGITSPRGRSIQDSLMAVPQHAPEMIIGPDIVVKGEVAMPLYNLGGQVSGVILKDHTLIHLIPREAARLADWLKPGQSVYAIGTGNSGVLGTAINAREIGPSADRKEAVAISNVPVSGPAAGSAGYDVISGGE